MAFKLHSAGNTVTMKKMDKDTATVLAAGDFCGIDVNGLAVVADALSAKLAYVMADAGTGTTEVYCAVADFTQIYFTGTGDAPFATTMRDTEVDMVINSLVQEIDVGASTTDVFRIVWGLDAGTVWSDLEIKFRLNKPIYL